MFVTLSICDLLVIDITPSTVRYPKRTAITLVVHLGVTTQNIDFDSGKPRLIYIFQLRSLVCHFVLLGFCSTRNDLYFRVSRPNLNRIRTLGDRNTSHCRFRYNIISGNLYIFCATLSACLLLSRGPYSILNKSKKMMRIISSCLIFGIRT